MKISNVGVVILFAGLLAGCTKLKQDLPPPVAPGVQAHGRDWVDTSSSGFHGAVIRANNGDFQSCLTCHGWDFAGGTSRVSCVDCHKTEGASIHGRGWTDPASPNFHGNAIRGNSWDMRDCQSCHGLLYAGGRVNSSCRDCHTGSAGPENCATCHGSTNPAPPRDLSKNTSRTARGVGAHQIHLLGGNLSNAITCFDCHLVPPAVYIPGHVDTPGPAEAGMSGSLANTVTNEPTTLSYSPSLPLFTPSPSYDAGQLKCSGTYCHGTFKNGNTGFAPVWNDVTGASTACGTCHGDVTRPTLAERALPKTPARGGTHPDVPNVLNCSLCHGDVVDANLRIINKSKHINGKLNVLGLELDF